MHISENDKRSATENLLQEQDSLYLSEENKNRFEAITKSDTEKFFLFTRMLRINSMLKSAKITSKKM